MAKLLSLAALLAALAALTVATLVATGTLGVKTRVVQQGATVTVAPASTSKGGTSSAFAQIRSIYQKEGPGVVQVNSESVVAVPSDPFFGTPSQQTQQALGSGFVVDQGGKRYIVTNYHVVQGAQHVSVSFSDQSLYPAKVVGSDPSTDLALLTVDAPAKLFDPLPLGDSQAVQIGDPVVAIGNPLGLDRTVTFGIVSALQRVIQAPNGFAIDRVIQTDAAINHGNSGGPLLDLAGRVIGVNSQIATDATGSGNIGIGFAIPANTVKSVVEQLADSGQVEHAFLGVRLLAVDSQIAKAGRLPAKQGLLIEKVDAGSAAAKAGLRAGSRRAGVGGSQVLLGGDLIVAADGKPTVSAESLRSLIAAKKPGDKLTLTIYRGSARQTVDVTLGAQPKSTG